MLGQRLSRWHNIETLVDWHSKSKLRFVINGCKVRKCMGVCTSGQQHTRIWPNAVLMLGQRPRRWPNIKTALEQVYCSFGSGGSIPGDEQRKYFVSDVDPRSSTNKYNQGKYNQILFSLVQLPMQKIKRSSIAGPERLFVKYHLYRVYWKIVTVKC